LHLSDGTARIAEARGYPDSPTPRGRYLNLSEWTHTYSGWLDGGGVSGAAVPLLCDNNGGTADGQLLFSLVVFSGKEGHARLIGLVTPRVQPRDEHATLIGGEGVRWQGNRLLIKEAFYGPHDYTCCPSGVAESEWTYRSGRLGFARSEITSEPR
jgi:hypothetical protein